jgi:hypothetical protein
MHILDDFDPSLFGTWDRGSAYAAEPAIDEAALVRQVRSIPLETKSAQEPVLDPSEELRRLLNEMTVEMREQFSTFRRLRTAAERALEDGDEAAQKLARADVKAATDAMSLIVRTLEKVDALQRQLARDRALEAERAADESGYEEAKARFMQMIEDRARDRAKLLFDAWRRDGPPADMAGKAVAGSPQPAADPAGAGDGGAQGRHGGEGSSRQDAAHRGDA